MSICVGKMNVNVLLIYALAICIARCIPLEKWGKMNTLSFDGVSSDVGSLYFQFNAELHVTIIKCKFENYHINFVNFRQQEAEFVL